MNLKFDSSMKYMFEILQASILLARIISVFRTEIQVIKQPLSPF